MTNPVAYRYRWKLDGEWTAWRVSDHSQKASGLRDLEEVPLFGALASSSAAPSGEAELVAWLHQIAEPNGETSELFSRGPGNPWSHWLQKHQDQCEYHRTPLYATPARPASPIEQGEVERLAITDAMVQKAVWAYEREITKAVDAGLNSEGMSDARHKAIREALTAATAVAVPGMVPSAIREAMQLAVDYLKETKHGSPARSAGHNARLVLEAALAASPSAQTDGGRDGR
ncbi:MAG: hypothetical protein E5V64_06690 [Mesorhizobium sp.]|uniref:hypothetical protein n=1 Tax=Mesorhizobium sp. TaxID=1871066 RepID=UPI00122037F8|nr:hypothetical protein [Mesorhizobium sp.]TIV83847.1 MAG: hypothetical protein E5V64_06690 [Mesorhizobium sp.]